MENLIGERRLNYRQILVMQFLFLTRFCAVFSNCG
jgi:hypothetical protein